MRRILYVILIIIVAFFLMSFIMVAFFQLNTEKSNCVEVIGKIKSVYEGGTKDMVFELENNKTTYYVNRGFENGFEPTRAKKDFTGKLIRLFYAKGWTPLAPFGTTSKHISHAVVNDAVIYSEWK